MKTFFQMREMKSFPDHKGRPGLVGGSLPRGASPVPVKFSRDSEVTAQDTLDWVKRAYEDLPESERKKSTVLEVKVFDNPEDVLVAIENAGINPEIDENGIVYGAYDFTNRVMYVSVWNGYENSLRNFYHEFGHSIVGMDESAANTWADAWENKNLKYFTKGGDGSGFRNHAGRPGKVGGSLPKDYHALSELESILEVPQKPWEMMDKDFKILWRGMSQYEYENIQDTGFIQSTGAMSFSTQKGETHYSTSPSRMYAEDNLRRPVIDMIRQSIPEFPSVTENTKVYLVGVKNSELFSVNKQREFYTTQPLPSSEIVYVLEGKQFGKENVLYKIIKSPSTKTMKGGPGSGFHGHAGRPGKVGGSQREGQWNSGGTYLRYGSKKSPMSDWGHAMFASAEKRPMHLEGATGGTVGYQFDADSNDPSIRNINDLNVEIENAWNLTVEKYKENGYYQASGGENISDILDAYISGEYSIEQIVSDFNPSNIVDSAASWDGDMGIWFYWNVAEPNDILAVITDDGAIVWDENLIQKVPDGQLRIEKSLSFLKSTWRPWSIFENTFTSVIFNALKEQLQLLIGWDDIANIGNDSSFWLQLDNLLNRSVLPIVQQIAQKAVKDTVNSIAMTVSYEMTSMAASEWAMLYSASQITKVNDTTKDAVRKAISEWIASGENGGIQELRKLLGELKDGNGQPLFDEARAKRIAQSELTSIYAGAKAKVLEANGYRKAVFIPRAHTNCRCYIQPATAPDGTKVIVWYTARDEMVCTREIETPFGTVKGCRELHRTIVSEGYAGVKLESNQWNPKEGKQ